MKSKLILCFALVLSGVWFNLNSNAVILYPKEPDGGRQMAMQFANYFIETNFAQYIGISITNDLTFAPPLPEYGTGNLAKGQLLADAPSGRDACQMWEYIFMRGTNAVAEAYLEADEKTRKPLKCTRFGSSIFNEEIMVALHKAEQLPQVQKQDYEARLFDAPWVDFCAVWLHGKSNDIIISLPSGYSRLNSYQPYSESEVVKVLKPLAQQRLKQLSDLPDPWNINWYK